MRPHHSAFTLVELSVVLVILGLLVGGIMSGQSLIRASELRAIPTERDKYVTALQSFRDKYHALPGDFDGAFRFWGTDCGTDTTDASTGCNGDGNGFIESANGETIKTWEHLSRAGMIEGSFDGTGSVFTVSGTNRVVPSASNVPASKLPDAYWLFNDCARPGMPGDHARGICLMVGAPGNRSYLVALPDLTNGEAWNIDTKVDDGFAATGSVRGNFALEDPVISASRLSIVSSAYALEMYRNYCSDWGPGDPYSIHKFTEDHKGWCSMTFIVE